MTGILEVVIEYMVSTGNWRFTGGNNGPLQWIDLREADRDGRPPQAYSLEVALSRQEWYEHHDQQQENAR